MQLSVVIPFFNEADNADPLLQEIFAVLENRPGLDYEMIAVDDGSTDKTLEQLIRSREAIPRLRIVRHRANLGQSTAIASGVHAARYPWIVTLDGDGQNDPADIPGLLAEWKTHQMEGPALIVGNRYNRHDTWLRRLSSYIANWIRMGLLRDDCPDTGCGLKLFPRAIFLNLPHFDHMHRFLPALCRRAGIPVVNIPVNHRPRTRGRSKYGVMNRLWVGIVDLLGVMWLQQRPCNPDIFNEHQ
jgi:dolichol-phosphate mannosyltransferase